MVIFWWNFACLCFFRRFQKKMIRIDRMRRDTPRRKQIPDHFRVCGPTRRDACGYLERPKWVGRWRCSNSRCEHFSYHLSVSLPKGHKKGVIRLQDHLLGKVNSHRMGYRISQVHVSRVCRRLTNLTTICLIMCTPGRFGSFLFRMPTCSKLRHRVTTG
jgi:hypothetical protein